MGWSTWTAVQMTCDAPGCPNLHNGNYDMRPQSNMREFFADLRSRGWRINTAKKTAVCPTCTGVSDTPRG
jgi:hypothetical protein